MKLRIILGSALLAAGAVANSAASAQSYTVTFGSGAGLFNGVLTTGGSANSGGYFLISSLTGTQGSNTISLIGPGGFPSGSIPNDNLFKPTANYIDGNGFSYAAGGVNYNVFYSSSFQICSSATSTLCDTNGSAVSNFTVTPRATGAVPEPSSWAMMMVGFGVAGLAMRRRRKPDVRVAFTV